MKKSIKLTMILLSGITVFDRALGQNLCVNSRGDTKVASRCPSGYRAVLNLRSTVTEQKLANTPLVTSGSIRPEAVIGSIHIAPKSILGAQIGDGVIETRHIARIHASKIEGLPSFELQPGSVNTEHLRDNAVTSSKIADNAVNSAKIENGAIMDEDIAPNARIAFSKIALPQGGIPGSSIAAGSIGAAQLASNSVDHTKIVAGAIRREALADNVVNSAKIENGTITDEDIATNARIAFSKIALPQGGIPGSSIAAGSIGAAQLAPNSVGSTNIVDGGIRREDLADNVINSAKIENYSIQSEDLRDGSVTRTKIPAGEIQNSHYAARSITGDKIALNQITSEHIQARAITNAHLDLSIATPPFFSFYNLINLPAITASSGSGITLTRFYSYSNQSLPNGYDSFYTNTTGNSAPPRYLITTNGALFGCIRFSLSVESLYPVGSGYRDFTLVASNRWNDANLMTLKTDNGQDAIVRVSDTRPRGAVEGSFRNAQGNVIIPWWVGLRVYSVANQGQSLPASSAEVRVTCK